MTWHPTDEHKKKMSKGMKRWLKKKWGCNFIDDEYIPLLGTMTDKELAKKIGVTSQAVHILRKKFCIASYTWLASRFGSGGRNRTR
jgi:hypothetical protein